MTEIKNVFEFTGSSHKFKTDVRSDIFCTVEKASYITKHYKYREILCFKKLNYPIEVTWQRNCIHLGSAQNEVLSKIGITSTAFIIFAMATISQICRIGIFYK